MDKKQYTDQKKKSNDKPRITIMHEYIQTAEHKQRGHCKV